MGFNPHPPRRAGDTWAVTIPSPSAYVSIRTRPEERVILIEYGLENIPTAVSIRTRPEERVIPNGNCACRDAKRFQSAPAPKSG